MFLAGVSYGVVTTLGAAMGSLFEMDCRTSGGGKATVIYARDKGHTGNGPKQAMPEG
ncbi:hypothetical protein [Streptomyces sp. SP18BB07]|uniref:hypothetical protein n=1 Tax=Streptomyces sp. SP18BB07 TaxID=3002522 RepID=UPI002E75C416|nr:hypothetical protein [Streptomyces sp. SP18BB07]MEE1763257.1 hypothetical protein [Streptomyces sp. SP18BB07]